MAGWSRRVLLYRVATGAAGAVLSAPLSAHARAPAPANAPHPELSAFDDLMSSFVRDQHVPGAAIAITRESRLVYARGFGFADVDRRQAVQTGSLFRIASISKPVTAVAVLQLVERGRLSLDAAVRDILELDDFADQRWRRVTIRHLLQHTGGWDSERSFDPMFRPAAIAKALNLHAPPTPSDVIRYMLRQPFDFDPGTRHAYSNFGYCLLGRAIERVAGVAYETQVRREVLAPLGIRTMRLGRTSPRERAPNEVSYYADAARAQWLEAKGARGRGPTPIGTWFIEPMDSHGGWIASAVEVARFAAAFDDPQARRILRPESIAAMFARPTAYDASGPVWYAFGWRVRALRRAGAVNTWHTGSLDGTSTLMVRRFDRTNWAVLFNARTAIDGMRLSDKIDPLLHQAADRVRRWPASDDFAGRL